MKVSLCALFVWDPWVCFSCSSSPEIFPIVFMLWQETWTSSAAGAGAAGPCLLRPFEKHQQVPTWLDPSQPGPSPCVPPGHLPQPTPCRCQLTVPLASQSHPECLWAPVTWASRGYLRVISDPHSGWGAGTGMIPILQMTKLRLGSDSLVQNDPHFYSEHTSSAAPSSQGAVLLAALGPQSVIAVWKRQSPPRMPAGAHSASPSFFLSLPLDLDSMPPNDPLVVCDLLAY